MIEKRPSIQLITSGLLLVPAIPHDIMTRRLNAIKEAAYVMTQDLDMPTLPVISVVHDISKPARWGWYDPGNDLVGINIANNTFVTENKSISSNVSLRYMLLRDLKTLGHEMRHIWQHKNGQLSDEDEATEWAEAFLAKHSLSEFYLTHTP